MPLFDIIQVEILYEMANNLMKTHWMSGKEAALNTFVRHSLILHFFSFSLVDVMKDNLLGTMADDCRCSPIKREFRDAKVFVMGDWMALTSKVAASGGRDWWMAHFRFIWIGIAPLQFIMRIVKRCIDLILNLNIVAMARRIIERLIHSRFDRRNLLNRQTQMDNSELLLLLFNNAHS